MHVIEWNECFWVGKDETMYKTIMNAYILVVKEAVVVFYKCRYTKERGDGYKSVAYAQYAVVSLLLLAVVLARALTDVLNETKVDTVWLTKVAKLRISLPESQCNCCRDMTARKRSNSTIVLSSASSIHCSRADILVLSHTFKVGGFFR